MLISIWVDGVVGKQRARSARNGAHYTPEKTRRYEQHLAAMARVQMAGAPPIQTAVAISIDAHFPVPPSWSKKKRDEALAGKIRPTVKPDFDNIEKIVSDALNGVVWRDDAQVVSSYFVKRYAERAGVSISVEQIG